MRITSKSVKHTLSLGHKISRLLKKGDIICLFGELGAGKTVLVKGIAQGLDISISEVISPSFTIARQYEGKLSLCHLDLYRLRITDILQLGYEDYLYGDGVAVIEWADRLDGYLPQEYLKIRIKMLDDNSRQIDVTAVGEKYKKFITSRLYL